MNSISRSIHEDLPTAEQEVSTDFLTEGGISALKEFCHVIKDDIETKYRDAAEKAARADVARTTNTARVMEENIFQYKARLRQILADLRRARSGTPGSNARSSPNLNTGSTVTTTTTGYKPFMERLKPPTFTGRVEDWPEFRSVWKELLSDYPEVQVQHMKANIPQADAR